MFNFQSYSRLDTLVDHPCMLKHFGWWSTVYLNIEVGRQLVVCGVWTTVESISMSKIVIIS